jgi:hypothetical protein
VASGIIQEVAVMSREGNTRRRSGSALRTTDAQYEALFASSLQKSDKASPAMATAAICDTIRELGSDGCADRMAQEFGDHPEEARNRMRWARELVGEAMSGR